VVIEHEHQRGRSIFMARIMVTTEQGERPGDPVLLDERVCPEHLSDDHSAAQLIERLGWAINDAEERAGHQAR
jgi:CTP:molybdopterin cytidylyltransferase MocA